MVIISNYSQSSQSKGWVVNCGTHNWFWWVNNTLIPHVPNLQDYQQQFFRNPHILSPREGNASKRWLAVLWAIHYKWMDFIIEHHTCWWHLGCSCFFSSLSHLFFSSQLVISSCLVPCFHPMPQFLCWPRQQHDTSWQVTCCFGLSTEQKNPSPIHCLYSFILWLSCSATTRSVVACLTFIDTEL